MTEQDQASEAAALALLDELDSDLHFVAAGLEWQKMTMLQELFWTQSLRNQRQLLEQLGKSGNGCKEGRNG